MAIQLRGSYLYYGRCLFTTANIIPYYVPSSFFFVTRQFPWSYLYYGLENRMVLNTDGLKLGTPLLYCTYTRAVLCSDPLPWCRTSGKVPSEILEKWIKF